MPKLGERLRWTTWRAAMGAAVLAVLMTVAGIWMVGPSNAVEEVGPVELAHVSLWYVGTCFALGGAVWAGTSSGMVGRLHHGTWTHYRPPGGVGREAVIALGETKEGVWVSAANGRLFLLRAGRFEDHTPRGVPQPRLLKHLRRGGV